MTLTQWASVGEIAASIAVVVSLIYLAIQVRQSTAVAQAQIRHSMMEFAQEQIFLQVTEPDVFRAAYKETLTENERIKYNMWLTGTMRAREYEWFAYRAGTIDREMFEAYAGVIGIVLGTERARRWWAIRRKVKEFDPGFTAFVDDLLERSPPTTYFEEFKKWD